VVSGFPAAVQTVARCDIGGSEAEIESSKDDQNCRQRKKAIRSYFPTPNLSHSERT
jgi:hypothetical protein